MSTRHWTLVAVVVAVLFIFIGPIIDPEPAFSANPLESRIGTLTAAVSDEMYGQLPLYFIQNDGQLDSQVKFYERGTGHSTFFAKDGVYLTLTRNQSDNDKGEIAKEKALSKEKETKVVSSHVKLSFLKARSNPKIVAEGKQEGAVNYLIGNDPNKWRTNIPTYQAVVYQEIYPGIDMKFYGNNRQMEYDIIVKPGADPSKVRLAYEGIEGLRVTADGDLEIGLKDGAILQKKPIVYQEIDGKRVDVAGTFKIEPRTNRHSKTFSYAFKVASYDATHPLVIDPILVYSTYLGGSGGDSGNGIAIDSSGNAYVTGDTSSTDFPTVNPIQAANGGGFADVFVTKINATGTALVYSTYLGGSDFDSNEFGHGIAVDSSGNVYVTGSTRSIDFPTMNALQATSHGGSEAFVTKLDPVGSALVYSTYLGGSGDEQGHGIAVDSSGNAYVTGRTGSACIDFNEFCFPTTPGVASPFFIGGPNDGFVTKIDAAGGVVYSSYLGTVDNEDSWGIAVDATGAAYVVMQWTNTTGDLTTDEEDHEDVLMFKVNPAGADLGYIKFFGGTRDDMGFAIAVDGSGNAYVTGSTTSTDFPTVNPIQAAHGGGSAPSDAFVAKITQGEPDNTGQVAHLVYATYLGGSGNEFGQDIAVDASGNAYVTGLTRSTNFPTVNPIQAANAGGWDAFVTKINSTGSAWVYSTYLGGSGGSFSTDERGNGIAVDALGNAYVTGLTPSTDFPTLNPIQATNATSAACATVCGDAFVLKIGRSVRDLFADLIVVINETIATNDSQGIPNSLDAKLEAAVSALDAARANSMTTARNQLNAFIYETEAQSGNLLTVDQADQLIDSANQIKAVLESP